MIIIFIIHPNFFFFLQTVNPPSSGKLEDILKEAEKIEVDKRCDICRKGNPLP